MLNNMIYLYKLAFIRITKFIIWSWTFNLHDTLFQYRPFSHCIFNIFLETMNIYMNIYIQEVQDSIILQKSFRFFDPIINYQIKFLYIKFHSSKEICSSIDSPCYLKFKCLSKNLNEIKIGSEKESSLIFNKWHQLFHLYLNLYLPWLIDTQWLHIRIILFRPKCIFSIRSRLVMVEDHVFSYSSTCTNSCKWIFFVPSGFVSFFKCVNSLIIVRKICLAHVLKKCQEKRVRKWAEVNTKELLGSLRKFG